MSDDVFAAHRQIADLPPLDEVRKQVAVVAGVGALGSHVVRQLADAGVGHIVAVDYDVIEPHNILRMDLVGAADVGSKKVDAIVRAIKNRYGDLVKITPIQERIEMVGPGLLERAGYVFLCTDTRRSRLNVCRTARTVGTPHISGAIDRLQGLILGPFDPPHTPCYECTLSRHEINRLLDTRHSCSAEPRQDPEGVSIPTTPQAAAVTAAWMVALMLRHHETSKSAARPYRIFVDLASDQVHVAKYDYARNDCTCRNAGSRPEPVRLPAARDEITPKQLIGLAAHNCGEDAQVYLGYTLVAGERCSRCNHQSQLAVPRRGWETGVCRRCGEATAPLEQISVITAEHPYSQLTFAELKLPLLGWIAVQHNRGAQIFELAGDEKLLDLKPLDSTRQGVRDA